MKDERPDASLLIGLHKLAATNGEGLVPELYEMLARERAPGNEADNILAFKAKSSDAAPAQKGDGMGMLLPFKR